MQHQWIKTTLKSLTGGSLILFSEYILADTQFRQPPHLDAEETRYYSHIHWQGHPGTGISVKLLPGVNATGKATYSIEGLSGKDHNTEVRTIPDAIDDVFYQLIRNTNYLNPDSQSPDYYVQFHIRRFDTLYAPGDRNHLLNLGFAHFDRSWSQLNGDNKPSKVSLTLVIYDHHQQPVLEVPVTSQLSSCERSGNPMPFSNRTRQQFFNGFATTTTGQAFIAAINRALEEAAVYFSGLPITGKVLKIEGNDIYINLGRGTVYPKETVNLLFQDDSALTPYIVSRLAVEETWHDMSIVHALDVATANVLPGDSIKLNKQVQQRQFVSVAGKPILCSKFKKDVEQQAQNEKQHWQWQDSKTTHKAEE